MKISEFIQNIYNPLTDTGTMKKEEGYLVTLNVKGNIFKDILLFGARDTPSHAFLLYSGTLLMLETLVEEPKPLTKQEIVGVLGEEYYKEIVYEYNDDAIGYASASSRLQGYNERRNFYDTAFKGSNIYNNTGIFKALKILEHPSLTNMTKHTRQYTVQQGILFAEVLLTINQTLSKTPQDQFVPLGKSEKTVIPAKGAILNHGDLAIKLASDVEVTQELKRTKTTYSQKEEVEQHNQIQVSVILKLDPQMPVSTETSYSYFTTQIQKLCKKQIEIYVRESNVNYKLVEVTFKDEGRAVELFGFLEESTGAVLSFRYPTILTKQVEIINIKHLTQEDVEEVEYQTMLEVQKELNKINDSEIRAYTNYAQRIRDFYDRHMKTIANRKGLHYQLAIADRYKKNVRYKNFFSIENDMYLVYNQEMFMTLPSSLRLEDNKHLVHDVDQKVRKSFERIVKEISEEYDDIMITNALIKTTTKDGKYVSVFALTWQYDKQFMTFDTDIKLPLNKVIDRLEQRFKTLKK